MEHMLVFSLQSLQVRAGMSVTFSIAVLADS